MLWATIIISTTTKKCIHTICSMHILTVWAAGQCKWKRIINKNLYIQTHSFRQKKIWKKREANSVGSDDVQRLLNSQLNLIYWSFNQLTSMWELKKNQLSRSRFAFEIEKLLDGTQHVASPSWNEHSHPKKDSELNWHFVQVMTKSTFFRLKVLFVDRNPVVSDSFIRAKLKCQFNSLILVRAGSAGSL